MRKDDPLGASEQAVAGRFDASAVLEHMADGFLAIDARWTCTYLNAAAETLLGHERDSLIGQDFWTSAVSLAGSRAEPTLRLVMAERIVATVDVEAFGRLFNARIFPLPDRGLALRLRDITAQRRGEERLALALDATGLGFWDYDVADDQLYWDERTRAICGMSSGQPLDGIAAFERALHPDDRARVLDAYRASSSGAAPGDYTMEFRVVRPTSGVERWVLATGRVVFGRDGRPARVVGTKLDITERKRAEQRLRQNEERLRLALDATGLGTWDHDLATGERVWSSAARALLGLPHDFPASRELLGRLIHPDDEADTARAYAAAFDPAADGTYHNVFRALRYDDGSERWMAIHGRVLFDETGRPVRALGVVQDVTEARRAEALLRAQNESLEARVVQRTDELETVNGALARERSRLWAVLEQLPIGVLLVSASGALVFQNAAARRMTGRDLSGVREWRDFAHVGAAGPDGVSLEFAEHALARAVRDGGVTTRKLQPFATGDDRSVTFEVSAAPVRGPGGEIELGVLAFEDVTARLEAEEVFRRAQRLEAIGQLTGGVAHDFNNLLTAILGNLEILGRRISEPRSTRLVENAARAADRGAKLTAQLLAFARKQRLQTQAVDVGQLVGSMAALLRGTLGGTIEILLTPTPRLWPALADPTQLELVVLNLAINARDAMPEGGRLTISAENVSVGRGAKPEDPPPGNFVALTITDTGTGMPAAVLARAFEPFFTTKEVGRGSGLGLAQVLGVAQQLGGGVRIASRAGAGTGVTVYLPQARSTEEQPPPPTPDAGARSLAGLSILLVDDDADVREITADLLQELGAAVVLAGNGVEAIERLDSHFDMVVLDFAMPLMTGIECAERIRQLYPRLPMLLISGHGDERVETDLCAMLRKPFPASALAQAIRSAIEERRTQPWV